MTDMFDPKSVFLGITPTCWTNDDFPGLGEDIPFEQCVSEMALAGYQGCSVGHKYPRDPGALKAALEFSPKDVALIGQLGTALYLSRDYEPALAILEPIMEQPPASEDVRVLTAYGDSLLQLDRVENAVRYLRRAFTADTSDRAASLSLARAYIRQEDFRAALPLLEWQLAGDTDGSVHVLLARALTGLGQTEKAAARSRQHGGFDVADHAAFVHGDFGQVIQRYTHAAAVRREPFEVSQIADVIRAAVAL